MVQTITAQVGEHTVYPAVGTVESDAWEPFLVNGVPTGRYHLLSQSQRSDGPVYSGVWVHRESDNPNGRFDFQQSVDECIYVIGGEAELTYPDSTVVKLTAGDTFFFPKGSEVVWRTLKDFTKFFVQY